jgi:hypothetical protein
MTNRRNWKSLRSATAYILAAIGGFILVLMLGTIVLYVASGDYPKGMPLALLILISMAGGILIGLGVATTRPKERKSSDGAIILDPLDVVENLEIGPPGTNYSLTEQSLTVSAYNRGKSGYLSIAFITCVISFMVGGCIINPETITPKWALIIFLLAMIGFWIGIVTTILFGHTKITIGANEVIVEESVIRNRTFTFRRSEVARVIILSYRGKGTINVIALENQDGRKLVQFGEFLPWVRQCYLRQVLQKTVVEM